MAEKMSQGDPRRGRERRSRMKIYKTDTNEIRVDTEDPILGALVSALIAQGHIEWVLRTPAEIDEEEALRAEEENCLFWAELKGIEEQPNE